MSRPLVARDDDSADHRLAVGLNFDLGLKSLSELSTFHRIILYAAACSSNVRFSLYFLRALRDADVHLFVCR